MLLKTSQKQHFVIEKQMTENCFIQRKAVKIRYCDEGNFVENVL